MDNIFFKNDHFFYYVAHFVFLRDVWIRIQRAAVASRCGTDVASHLPNNLATHLPNLDTHLSPTQPPIPLFVKYTIWDFFVVKFNKRVDQEAVLEI